MLPEQGKRRAGILSANYPQGLAAIMYPPETRDEILKRIADGESLRAICSDGGMPDRSTVENWLQDDADFSAKYARAREAQADGIFDGMADIEARVSVGDLRPDAARVVLESQRWRAEKLKPKVYGSKTSVEVSGSLHLKSDEELDREIAAKKAALGL